MALTKEDVFNLASDLLAEGHLVAAGAAATDTHKVAKMMERWWVIARDEVLTDAPWPWNMRQESLGAATVFTTDVIGWVFGYEYPTWCLKVKAVLPEIGVLAGQPPYPFAVMYHEANRRILCNVEDAFIHYYREAGDSALTYAHNHFYPALAAKLAWYVSFGMTTDTKVSDSLAAKYQFFLAEAVNKSMDEDGVPLDGDSRTTPWIEDRFTT